MNEQYLQLERQIRELLDSLLATLTPDERADVAQFLDAGEYGIALETLCAIIEEAGYNTSPVVRTKIFHIAQQMDLTVTLPEPTQ